MKNIKAIFIDWNGTLSKSSFFEQMNNFEHPYHQFLPTIEEWLFRHNKKLCFDWMYGRYSSEKVIEMMSKDLQIEYDILLNELKVSCDNMKFISDEIPELVNTIKKHGIHVVIATDNMDCFTRWAVPALKLDELFDEILNSCDLGILKNDLTREGIPLFFENYMRKNDIDYSDAVLLDDSLKTCELLSATGIQCVHIDSVKTMIDTLKQY